MTTCPNGKACFHEKNVNTFAEVTRMPSATYLYENNKKGSFGEYGPKRGHFCCRLTKADPLWPGMGPLKPSMFAYLA